MSSSSSLSRRAFLQRSTRVGAAGLAAPYVIPSGVLAATGRPGANDRVGIGFIAVGRRGRSLIGSFSRLRKHCRIVAISDVNEKRLDEVGKDKPWKRYPDYRKLLESRDVDAVVISTPDHWHALNAVHACQAGKDVYCEKPMTLTVREGRAMVDAVRKHKRVFQTGSQQRSMVQCRLGCELIRSGRIGKIRLVHGANYPSPYDRCDAPAEPVPEGLNWDAWCGQTTPRPFNAALYLPRPDPTGWISHRAYSGGEMTGWGAHGLDIIQWALGKDDSGPCEVWPTGTGRTCPVNFRYDNGIVVRLDGQSSGGGGLFEGDRGKILVVRRKCQSWPAEIAKDPLTDKDVHLPVSTDHCLNFIRCIRSRNRPICDVQIGHRSSTMCHLGNIARWTGRRLKWDPKKEAFVGDHEANGLLQRPMRPPYTL